MNADKRINVITSSPYLRLSAFIGGFKLKLVFPGVLGG
jgi:hypothetical protein